MTNKYQALKILDYKSTTPWNLLISFYKAYKMWMKREHYRAQKENFMLAMLANRYVP